MYSIVFYCYVPALTLFAVLGCLRCGVGKLDKVTGSRHGYGAGRHDEPLEGLDVQCRLVARQTSQYVVQLNLVL